MGISTGAGGGAAGAPAGGNIIWRWNGVDASEVVTANAIVSGSVNGVSASVVQREQGPALRIQGTRTGSGNGLLAVPFNIGVDLPERYVIKMRMREAAGIAVPDWAGAEIFSNGLAGASRFGACAMSDHDGGMGTAGVAPIIEAGAFGADWETFNSGPFDDANTVLGNLFEYRVAINRSQPKPEGSVVHRVLGSTSSITFHEGFVQGDFPSGGWVPGDCVDFGFCMRDLSAPANDPIAVDLSDLIVEAVDLLP